MWTVNPEVHPFRWFLRERLHGFSGLWSTVHTIERRFEFIDVRIESSKTALKESHLPLQRPAFKVGWKVTDVADTRIRLPVCLHVGDLTFALLLFHFNASGRLSLLLVFRRVQGLRFDLRSASQVASGVPAPQ